MIFRILAAIILLISILFWPFWLSVLLGLAGLFYFRRFVETPLVFLLGDALYGAGDNRLAMFFGATIALVIIELLKKVIKFYPKEI